MNFNHDAEVQALLGHIASRAVDQAARQGFVYEFHEILMPLEFCHCNGCPLDLERLLAAGDGDFMHDVFGIHNNCDPVTGALTNDFWPRFAVKQ